ncbi:hypothetical protein V6N12_061317 [Hibiscus sabdariffa]|uniref:Uncharacterized protein n=1 Tax=Hibiscus sabdariffa TaxID=183260 RepID=A0ABR2DWQ1_9ROSI
MPCCFFIVCKFLTMEDSFGSLFWNHSLFVSAHLVSVCDHNNRDLWLGKLLFFTGILLLSLHTIYYIWCYPQQRSDSAEKNRVHVIIMEISVSFMANGMALVGRWFVPRDNLSGLMFGAGAMFSIGVVFFCCYRFSSGKFKKP